MSQADRTRTAADVQASSATPASSKDEQRSGCGCGCKGEQGTAPEARSTREPATTARARAGGPRTKMRANGGKPKPVVANTSRAVALARRHAQSARGKAGLSPRGMTTAQTARATNPGLSGRELAQALREQRSRTGNAGQKKAEPCGRVRPQKARKDAPPKVGASETAYGQHLTGTMVGRSRTVTGDEPGSCKPVTGTEYMGAEIFRDFCQTEPTRAPRKVGVSPTSHGNRVSGNEVGRSTRVTGDEPGTCARVTGTEYLGADQVDAFCGVRPQPAADKITVAQSQKGKPVTGSNVGRSERVTGDEVGANRALTGTQYMQQGNGQAPAKVGTTTTLRGGSVTGTMVGRSTRVTGDEPGSCRNVTGDAYLGSEHFEGFCESTPAPEDEKVGLSQTFKGLAVTGTLTGRSGKVTGDEPGTCKAITGTPYAGAEQYRGYCEPAETQVTQARTQPRQRTAGAAMTGIQPGIGGPVTGAAKGACEPVSGTPYVGADQVAEVCPATAAEPGSPDFPQPVGGQPEPWGQFSVIAPAHAAVAPQANGTVTGTRYEQGQITGPFGMATGKVTGTEEFRFGRGVMSPPTNANAIPPTAETVEGRVKSRVTGEGMDGGVRITGDDWDRGDRVTGTEGASAMRRNPTRRGGPMSAMPPEPAPKRNEDLPLPVAKVTGGSGNTDRGALVTYSGGARG
ncbi:carboxysome shell protein [Thioalkalivibrio paradoxus ARh 1]|uniref:Carboxysome shell protein n=1 Tax=Thioalkalivibrio paradoxus ARh 1 TaxID=713585 RepID=W0DNU2_9GAMM|nr:CsoS2 family carboxysome shell protein [Thioalkalivibrio paradoxus]AHE98922.1 carboxysome shell protein [Thioalkalivibrio paradoxus ARh 1]